MKLHSCPVKRVWRAVIGMLLLLSGAWATAQPNSDFDWRYIQEIHPGIQYAEIVETEPRRLVIHILKIDLTTPRLRLHVTERDSKWGEVMPSFSELRIETQRQNTLEFLNAARSQGMNMVVAINASPWRPWAELNRFQKVFFPYASKLGLVVSNGVMVSPADHRPSLIIRWDGSCEILNAAERQYVVQEDIQLAVSGFDIVLRDGEPSGGAVLEPRTGMGLSRDRTQLILIAVDGRRAGYSEGISTRELGQWLRYFGAWSGLNMDGGGSTTLVVWNPERKRAEVANRPSGMFLRKTGSNLGIYYEGGL